MKNSIYKKSKKRGIYYTPALFEKTPDNFYRCLIEKMHEGAVTLSFEGNVLYCNSCFANMVKLPSQRIIGSKFTNFSEPSAKEHIEAMLGPSLQNASKEKIYLQASNGMIIPVLISINKMVLDNVFLLGIILTDLSAKYEIEKELLFQLEEKEKRADELIIADKELEFQTGEKKKRADELIIADKELEFQTGEKKKRADELIIADKELEFQTSEKIKRAVELISAKSEVKELEELNLHKENIIHTLSHDLRSPLTGIIGIAEELKSNFENLEPLLVKKMLDLLHKASTNELMMLDKLVEWARIKYASEAFAPQEFMLEQYVRRVFNSLNENAAAKNIQLINEIEENLTVFADGNMLLSILQNIISNSIKYTPSNGKVMVSAIKTPEYKIVIKIQDTGIGMSKELQDQLFIPQVISLSSLIKESKGAGIGMLLVNTFVEKNGGEICVESIENEGTSVYFTLRNTNRDSIN